MSRSLLPMFTTAGSLQACGSCKNLAQGDGIDKTNYHNNMSDGWCRAWLQNVRRFQVCGRYTERHGT